MQKLHFELSEFKNQWNLFPLHTGHPYSAFSHCFPRQPPEMTHLGRPLSFSIAAGIQMVLKLCKFLIQGIHHSFFFLLPTSDSQPY